MTELKKCPFCGGEARLWHPKEYGITLGSVKCNSCGASTESFTDDDSAIEAWNKRSYSEKPNNWHTGTPTEGGLYFVYDKYCGYAKRELKADISKEQLEFAFHDVLAWQKITPYEEDRDYERAVEQMEYDIRYEPTYNPEDGSM